MKLSFQSIFLAFGLSVAALASAYADGEHKMYTTNGAFLGTLYVEGNISGGKVYLELSRQRMKFYVNPKGIYVSTRAGATDIPETAKKPFKGHWVSYEPQDRRRCRQGATKDHGGMSRPVWGHLVWTNLSLKPKGNIKFKIDIGLCGGPVKEWAVSG